jgi:hypothetical protein
MSINSSLEYIGANHFGNLVPAVTKLLINGESVVIYGMPGYGRKHFLRLMERVLIQNEMVKTVFIECLANAANINKVLSREINNLTGSNESELDYLRLERFLKTQKLIVILGHIEEVENKQELFSTLLKIRELGIDKFALLSSADQTIKTQKDEYMELGEIMFANVIRMPLFNMEGTKRILEINRDYFGYGVPDTVVSKIFSLTGGNPALIKHLGKYISEMGDLELNNLDLMLKFTSLEIKLKSLVKVLISEDKWVLEDIGMIGTSGELFSPILKEYLKRYELENQRLFLPQLSPREARILLFLLTNRDRLTTIDKIGFLMNLTEDNFSMWAVYKAISRLKNRVKDRYEIKVVKNRGYLISEMLR